MGKKLVAVVGSYRKGGVIDSAIDILLRCAEEQGAETEKVYLIDRHIEFCTNCRNCTQEEGAQRGICTRQDDMDVLLSKLEEADGLIIGSPVNFFNVTAVTRRFIERLVCYAFWPWGKPGPSLRSKARKKTAVLVTSSAMPAPLGRLFTGALRILKITARTLGAEPIGVLYIGTAALQEKQPLPPGIVRRATKLGRKLGTA